MNAILATNITSPLGMTTAANLAAVKSGRSELRRYDGLWGLPEPFCASLFTEAQRQVLAIDGLTRFESLAVRSVQEALVQCPGLDVSSESVLFILSTTKADISEATSDPSASVGAGPVPARCPLPSDTAAHIASHLGFTTLPVVVCNACISGVAAIILAQRLIDAGDYDYVVVCGADVQCPFTIAGFQSLKAVSADPCRPFDMERTGLNLGEAAATIVLGAPTPSGYSAKTTGEHPLCSSQLLYGVLAGAIRNDAFHISSPSKNGEGAFLALHALGRTAAAPRASGSAGGSPATERSEASPTTGSAGRSPALRAGTGPAPTLINAHGTATMFNDQMESVAIERAGLATIPVNGLKGYYGHTLGAAGVLETVLTLAALREGTVLATRGFSERGVSGKIHVTTDTASVGAGPVTARDAGEPPALPEVASVGAGPVPARRPTGASPADYGALGIPRSASREGDACVMQWSKKGDACGNGVEQESCLSNSAPSFIKMISGFGGGNAAIAVGPMGNLGPMGQLGPMGPMGQLGTLGPMGQLGQLGQLGPMGHLGTLGTLGPMELLISHRVTLTPTLATLDGCLLSDDPSLTALYKRFVGDYPKFYKMDGLSRLGFLAAELLLQAERKEAAQACTASIEETATAQDCAASCSRAIVLFNGSSSVATDLKFLATLAPDDFFPSPSLFVYTLPNIVTGEIALRHGYHGETSFYILPCRDEDLMQRIVQATFRDLTVKSVITGWLDFYDDGRYEADLRLCVSQ